MSWEEIIEKAVKHYGLKCKPEKEGCFDFYSDVIGGSGCINERGKLKTRWYVKQL